MVLDAVTNPAACVARGIENIRIRGENSERIIIKVGCAGIGLAIAITVFPAFVLLELAFKHLPKMILAIPCCHPFI
ncbi:MAG: hypothetical protein H0X51_02485 [Parachlamydiaceae bacterium]|nr:hypothetical protein [Parachlamydiaceae bacterium]